MEVVRSVWVSRTFTREDSSLLKPLYTVRSPQEYQLDYQFGQLRGSTCKRYSELADFHRQVKFT